MDKKIQVVCIGLGQRGRVYLNEIKKHSDLYSIVALCDINENRCQISQKEYSVSSEFIFTDEDAFFSRKMGDFCIIATQDKDHVRHCLKALKAGYNILCEKPITADENELKLLHEAKNKTGKKILICHVLRYAPAYKKVKELIENDTIGKLIMIDAIENVGYSHQAHSYVRGNWRRSEETSPMILAKCCHDLDLLTWFIKGKCLTVSSIGNLNYFKKENHPNGASDRCKDCKLKGKCVFDAYDLYIKSQFWGRGMITDKPFPTDDEVKNALDTGPYGRCVFMCDNNVVDNQITMMRFDNNVDAVLKMTAFSPNGGRIYKFYGTKGAIDLDETSGFIDIKIFNKEKERIPISTLIDATNGHGGGDSGLINSLFEALNSNDESNFSSLDESIESHLIAYAAEKSRMSDGKLIYVEHF